MIAMFLMSSRACTANLSGAVAQREPGPILGPNGESQGYRGGSVSADGVAFWLSGGGHVSFLLLG